MSQSCDLSRAVTHFRHNKTSCLVSPLTDHIVSLVRTRQTFRLTRSSTRQEVVLYSSVRSVVSTSVFIRISALFFPKINLRMTKGRSIADEQSAEYRSGDCLSFAVYGIADINPCAAISTTVQCQREDLQKLILTLASTCL